MYYEFTLSENFQICKHFSHNLKLLFFSIILHKPLVIFIPKYMRTIVLKLQLSFILLSFIHKYVLILRF